MSERLFKAKRIDNGEWVEGSFIDSGNHEQVFIYPHYNGASTMPCRNLVYHRMIAVDVETICQYTGLTDKNGNKIWENDIVVAHFRSNKSRQKFKIIFEDGMFLFDNSCVEVPKYDVYGIELIGNIFDNEDLLKGE